MSKFIVLCSFLVVTVIGASAITRSIKSDAPATPRASAVALDGLKKVQWPRIDQSLFAGSTRALRGRV
jgi:hypothetical protein